MKWENIIKRKMADTNITIFNQEVIDILSNRNHLSAAEIYDNLSRRFKNMTNPSRVTHYARRIPGVSYNKTGGKLGIFSLNEPIQKAKGGKFLEAVAELLTDEWVPTSEIHEKSLNLKTKEKNPRPYKNTLAMASLTLKLKRNGYGETKKEKGKTFIRRKQ